MANIQLYYYSPCLLLQRAVVAWVTVIIPSVKSGVSHSLPAEAAITEQTDCYSSCCHVTPGSFRVSQMVLFPGLKIPSMPGVAILTAMHSFALIAPSDLLGFVESHPLVCWKVRKQVHWVIGNLIQATAVVTPTIACKYIKALFCFQMKSSHGKLWLLNGDWWIQFMYTLLFFLQWAPKESK